MLIELLELVLLYGCALCGLFGGLAVAHIVTAIEGRERDGPRND